MPPKAGDTVFSFGSITIDAEDNVTIGADVALVAKDASRHALRSQRVEITLTNAQKAQVEALRASLEASVVAAPPNLIKDATKVIAKTREERRAERLAARLRPPLG
jgi:hypothetical protein